MSYMANQMDDLIEGGIQQMDSLMDELYEACRSSGMSFDESQKKLNEVCEAVNRSNINGFEYIKNIILGLEA